MRGMEQNGVNIKFNVQLINVDFMIVYCWLVCIELIELIQEKVNFYFEKKDVFRFVNFILVLLEIKFGKFFQI